MKLDSPKAFSPFFTDIIAIRGVRKGGNSFAQTAKACVLDLGFDDPLCEDSTGSVCRVISVQIRAIDWRNTNAPQIGDSIEWHAGNYRVMAVSKIDNDYEMKARAAGC